MISGGDVDPHKGMKSSGNGKYVVRVKSFSLIVFFFLEINKMDCLKEKHIFGDCKICRKTIKKDRRKTHNEAHRSKFLTLHIMHIKWNQCKIN